MGINKIIIWNIGWIGLAIAASAIVYRKSIFTKIAIAILFLLIYLMITKAARDFKILPAKGKGEEK